MTKRASITNSILVVILSVLPLVRVSIDDSTLTRSTWSWLAIIFGALIIFFALNYKRVQQKYVYFFLGSTSLIILSALIGLHRISSVALVYSFLTLLISTAIITSSARKQVIYIALTCIACASLYAQWGATQFILQHDLGLTKIGESLLNINTPGVASFYIHDQKFIRSYGPFAHANILGGVLAVAILLLTRITIKTKLFTYSILASIFIGLLTTFSRTAILSAILIGIYITLTQKKRIIIASMCILIALFSPLLVGRSTDSHDVAAHDRLEGLTWAKNMTTPITLIRGLGLGNYEKALSSYLESNSIPHFAWDIAPVHSAPIFLVMEFGIFLSAIIFLTIIYFIYKHNAWILLTILPALFFDHYFVTQIGALAWLTSCTIILSRVY